jgi:cell division protein FtsB
MWAEIQSMEATLAEQRAILQRNERQERLLSTSSEYLSMKARDRLDLMQEGETLYRFEAATKR